MRYPGGGGLTAAERARREQVWRMQYQPGLLDGFLAGAQRDLALFNTPRP